MHDAWAQQRLQFGVLYRVFLMRVVDLELLAADADTTRLVTQFATIFAGLSFMFSLPMLVAVPVFIVDKVPDGLLTAKWTPEHFFIATTMLVAGVLAVLTWDSAFPDRRDVLVLMPLPVRAVTLFLAKIAALFAAPALAILALNVFSGLLWPVLFASHNGSTLHALRAWPAYWITMAAAGAFIFCSLLTVQGIAANLLPRQIFLRTSAFLQAGVLCTLLIVYFLEPSLESPAALTAPHNQRLLACLPTYWFLGMFQQLNGSMHPAFGSLATRAWIGLAASVAGATTALFLAYFRLLPRIVEQPEIIPSRHRAPWIWPSSKSLHAVLFAFSLRTLLRSRQHRMILSLYLGVGLAILVGYLTGPFGPAGHQSGFGVVVLVASSLMTILAVMALRVVSAIPISLRANWIFRVTQVRPADQYWSAVRTSWLSLGVAPVWFTTVLLMFAFYPWRPVAGHLAVLLLLGTLGVECCLYGFQKISFACSYQPGKANIHVAFWGSLCLSIWVLNRAATLENRMLLHWRSGLLMILVLTLIVGMARWLSHTLANPSAELLFEDEQPPLIITLKLN